MLTAYEVDSAPVNQLNLEPRPLATFSSAAQTCVTNTQAEPLVPPVYTPGSTKPELTPLADALGICADGDIAVVFDNLGVDNAPYPTVGASHGIFTGIENFGGRVPDPIANAFSGLGSASASSWTRVPISASFSGQPSATRPTSSRAPVQAPRVGRNRRPRLQPNPRHNAGRHAWEVPVVVINHGYEQVMRGVLDQDGQELSTVFDPYQGVGDDLAVCMSWAEHGWIAVMSAYRGVPLYITTGGFPIVSSLQEVDDILRKAPEPVEPEGCLGEVTDVLRLTDIVLNTGWEVLPYNVTPDLAHVLMWGYSDGGCVTDRAVEQTGGNLATAVATIDAPTDFTVWYRDCLANQQRGPFDGGPPCCTLPGNPDPPDAGCVWCTQGQPDGGPPYPADTLCAQDQQNGGRGRSACCTRQSTRRPTRSRWPTSGVRRPSSRRRMTRAHSHCTSLPPMPGATCDANGLRVIRLRSERHCRPTASGRATRGVVLVQQADRPLPPFCWSWAQSVWGRSPVGLPLCAPHAAWGGGSGFPAACSTADLVRRAAAANQPSSRGTTR